MTTTQITGYRWAKRTKTQQLVDELTAAAEAPKKNKFNAVRTEVDGIIFDSKKEARRYSELKIFEREGYLQDLKRQQTFKMEVNGVKITTYRADFTYIKDGKLRVEDVKSEPTAKKSDFRMKVKLMRACHGIEVEVLL